MRQILIIDDDADFREELRESLGAYKVIEASNGNAALDFLKKSHAIDLVLLDILMPGLPGIDVLKEIRKTAPSLGVIVMTGNGSKEVAVDALQGHADDYIEKPFTVEHLCKAIEKIIISKDNDQGIVIGKIERAKDFLKNNIHKKVTLKDMANELCLSPKYFSRLFKKRTGMGFNDYRLNIKIKMAQQLLSTTSLSIQELTLRLGYKNLESFVRIFKNLTGYTPTTYRDHTKGKSHAKSSQVLPV